MPNDLISELTSEIWQSTWNPRVQAVMMMKKNDFVQ